MKFLEIKMFNTYQDILQEVFFRIGNYLENLGPINIFVKLLSPSNKFVFFSDKDMSKMDIVLTYNRSSLKKHILRLAAWRGSLEM